MPLRAYLPVTLLSDMQDVNHSDLKQVASARDELQREAQVRRQRELDDFNWVMADKRGRRFVWRLLSMTSVFSSTFRESTKEQDFLEGARSLGLAILADAHESCLSLYHQMERENASHARRTAAR